MRRVYIGKFSHHIRERDIERFFRSEGRIREVLMKDGFAFVEFEHTSDAETAVKRLDGRDLSGERVHVEFAKGPPRTARDGMRGGGLMGPGRNSFMGSNRHGSRDRGDRGDRMDRDRSDNRGSGIGSGISYAEKYGPPRNTDFRVIVENLSSRVSWQDLKDLMRQAGEVTFADAHKRERNMGIVDFATAKDMRHAIDTLNDTEFHGRRIKVYEDRGRRREGGGGGGGRDDRRDMGGRRGGRSRSRSRSRSHTRRRHSNSRSRSRDRAPVSRSRSRTPVARDRDAPSRSRSISSSPVPRRKAQRSPSKSRSRSRSRSRSVSRNRDNSRVEKRQSRSRSRSATPAESPARSKSRSRSRSTSSSKSNGDDANNGEPTNNNNNDADVNNKLTGGDYSPRRSASRSRSREPSRTPSPSSKKARLSASPGSPASEKAEG